jgi:hypothetical protein
MQVTRKSLMSGQVNTLELDVTPEQMERLERRQGLVQDIFPNLPAGEREFLLTGTTPEEWQQAIGRWRGKGALR